MDEKKGMLSQEEINALLSQNNMEQAGPQPNSENREYLDSIEKDALGEIGNISFGSSATALSTLLGQKVDITTPRVSVIQLKELHQEFPIPHVAVSVQYTDGFEGTNLFVIRTEDAQIIADLMMGGDGSKREEEISELHLSAVQEAMNQMMGSAATSMSTIFNQFVNISPPIIKVMDLSKEEPPELLLSGEDNLVKISFQLKVGESGSLIDSNIMQLIPVSFGKRMVEILMGTGDASQEAAAAVTITVPYANEANAKTAASEQSYPQTHHAQPQPQANKHSNSSSSNNMVAAGMSHQPQTIGGSAGFAARPANVHVAEFSQFPTEHLPGVEGEKNLGLLLDIPLMVTVELGRTKKQIREILELAPGSLVELDKLAGEPVDILVNNKLIAKGEVVVIDENFGVRVTDIISQWDRVQKLQ